MRLVFMGTPDFAVPCLRALLDAGHEVCAVYTQPDKPKGRGYALTPPPVKVLAAEKEIPVFQPQTLRTPGEAQRLAGLNPDAVVVVAYGKILPKEILDIPPKGCINVHASLLPRYRGAAPIQWSVINGDAETGVTTMYMAEGLDTGDMLLTEKTPIGTEETAGELHDRLSEIGARVLVQTMEALADGTAVRIPQGEMETPYAQMLTKELGHIGWALPAQTLHNLVRGLSPWPVAYTEWAGKRLKICRSRVAALHHNGMPGSVFAEEERLYAVCGDSTVLELLEVQYEGGKRMDGYVFLCGHRAMLESGLDIQGT